ncbi:MAG: PilN domain-containing protein [Desulfobacterales bacterium]|nr:PilN domain-containing protein [Desulfobacterales bacterium]
MITINLLPVKQIQRRLQARNQVFIFAGFVVGLMVLLALGGLGLNQKIAGLKDRTAALEAEQDSYQSILNEIDKLKKDKAALENKLAVIAKLKKGSRLTVRILDEIANLTPANKLWLTSLSQADGQLQLAGIALDNANIASYMELLDGSYLFADPELQGSSLYMLGGQRLKSFSLTCDIIEPDQGEPEGEG